MKEELDDEYIDDEEKEIDIVELFGKLWKRKRFIIWWGVVGVVLGLVVAFSIPKEYGTTVTLAPELTSSKTSSMGGLSSIAQMVGINLNTAGTSDAVNPMLYPEIVASVPFLTGLFNVEVTTEEGQVLTFRDYMEYKTSSPWWSAVIKLPFQAIGAVKDLFEEPKDTTKHYEVDPFRLSLDQSELVETLQKCITSDVDNKTAVITVNVSLQDPLVSALVADTVVTRLQEYVTQYRTEKARNDMEYARKINEEARQEYYKAQRNYTNYTDRNQGIITRSGLVESERLQNEMNLAFSLYNNTAQQYQLARAKVQEITPVYSVLQPATVAVKHTKPSKPLILIAFVFLAVAGASVWVLFGQDFMANLRNATKGKSKEDEDAPADVLVEQ